MRLSIALGVALAALSLAGCPRELQPPPPGDGPPCAGHADCNEGRTCGPLALCVGGLCEDAPSLAVPCPEEGVPVPLPDPAE